MAAMTINGKYMVLIRTTNQPVNITPMLSRFSTIKKALTMNEIGACLAAHAKVTLLTIDRSIELTRENYVQQLREYKSSLEARLSASKDNAAARENEKLLNDLAESEQAAPAEEPAPAPAPTRSKKKSAPAPEPVVEEAEEPAEEVAEEEAPIGEAGETAQADPEDPDDYPDEVFYQE